MKLALSAEAQKNQLLASVSRSFYLTIRALPGPLRPPVRTAYLLARAADTIADTAAIPVAERRQHLRALAECILEKNDPEKTLAIGIGIVPWQTDPAEKTLIINLFEVLADYEALDPADRADTREVLAQITRGQEQDLLFFDDPATVRALPDDAALEEYTWLVAGCVGEFWTRVCARQLPHFASRPMEEMLALGKNYGKGLQLVNILRDLRADLQNGRCYLPVSPVNLWENPAAQAIYGQWLVRARALLADGWRYTLALRSWRLRFACALPVLIGERTLALLERADPWQTTERVKVSRAEIRQMLWQTAWRVGSRRLLERYRLRLPVRPR